MRTAGHCSACARRLATDFGHLSGRTVSSFGTNAAPPFRDRGISAQASPAAELGGPGPVTLQANPLIACRQGAAASRVSEPGAVGIDLRGPGRIGGVTSKARFLPVTRHAARQVAAGVQSVPRRTGATLQGRGRQPAGRVKSFQTGPGVEGIRRPLARLSTGRISGDPQALVAADTEGLSPVTGAAVGHIAPSFHGVKLDVVGWVQKRRPNHACAVTVRAKRAQVTALAAAFVPGSRAVVTPKVRPVGRSARPRATGDELAARPKGLQATVGKGRMTGGAARAGLSALVTNEARGHGR
jgi:hypothetical protein